MGWPARVAAIIRENRYGTDGNRTFIVFRVGNKIALAAHALADGKPFRLVRVGAHVGEWGFLSATAAPS
jgi:hypothetical protein